MSHLEEKLAKQVRDRGLPQPETQALVVKGRQFKWDFSWPEHKLAVEVQGGRGNHAHGTVAGRTRDSEKLAIGQFLGYTVLHITSPMIRDNRAIKLVEWALSHWEDVYFSGETAESALVPGWLLLGPKTRKKGTATK